jgi:hypothetical protein
MTTKELDMFEDVKKKDEEQRRTKEQIFQKLTDIVAMAKDIKRCRAVQTMILSSR